MDTLMYGGHLGFTRCPPKKSEIPRLCGLGGHVDTLLWDSRGARFFIRKGKEKVEHERERNIENYLRHHLAEMGLKCIKFIPDHVNGMPDRLILLPGRRVMWVELKTDNGKLSEIQRYQHEILRGLGQEVVVVWSKEEANKLLDRLEGEYPG